MKLCVLAAEDSWHLNDLRRAARADEQIEALEFSRLSDLLVRRPHPLERFNCLLARAMPGGSLQQVVVRMDLLLTLERLGVKVVNPPRAIEMAVDKYLSLSRLQEAQIPIPATAVAQTLEQAMEFFDQLGQDVVNKPLFGSMGRGLERINTVSRARERFSELEAIGEVIYQQEFVPHADFDYRLLVIGTQVWGMKRVNPHHWISNLSQGAIGLPYQPTDTERNLALAAARAVSAEIAGVDVIVDQRSGAMQVVEINSAPSWKGISEVLQLDFARIVLDYLSNPNSGGSRDIA